MSRLAAEHQAINLGQGFPDFDGPDEIKHAAKTAIDAGHNQYALSAGQTVLREAIAAHAQRFYGQSVHPDTEITVTCGASEALFLCMMALVDPGDEVIVLEPSFDVYVPDVLMAGGVPRFVPLRPPAWTFDPDELAAAFNHRTRLILVNTPHNPTGRVFTPAELQTIADLCQKWNVIAVSDEVYEHLLYDDAHHRRIAQLPGMAERAITISSHGKTFSFTGWKTGWAIAPPNLTSALRRVHQFLVFASATPMQHAAAHALALPDAYYQTLRAEYQARRDFLAAALRAAGLRLADPAGTYFILADFSALGFTDDVTFCRWLTTEIGVAAIPPSAFFSPPNQALGQTYARFAFCKRMETLAHAATRLQQRPLRQQP
jgi:N-succinyldiaminopimelate aminotransferase